jgi:hypothetical protein
MVRPMWPTALGLESGPSVLGGSAPRRRVPVPRRPGPPEHALSLAPPIGRAAGRAVDDASLIHATMSPTQRKGLPMPSLFILFVLLGEPPPAAVSENAAGERERMLRPIATPIMLADVRSLHHPPRHRSPATGLGYTRHGRHRRRAARVARTGAPTMDGVIEVAPKLTQSRSLRRSVLFPARARCPGGWPCTCCRLRRSWPRSRSTAISKGLKNEIHPRRARPRQRVLRRRHSSWLRAVASGPRRVELAAARLDPAG